MTWLQGLTNNDDWFLSLFTRTLEKYIREIMLKTNSFHVLLPAARRHNLALGFYQDGGHYQHHGSSRSYGSLALHECSCVASYFCCHIFLNQTKCENLKSTHFHKTHTQVITSLPLNCHCQAPVLKRYLRIKVRLDLFTIHGRIAGCSGQRRWLSWDCLTGGVRRAASFQRMISVGLLMIFW